MTRAGRCALALASVMVLAPAAMAGSLPGQTPESPDGQFTAAQAARGRIVHARHCASCHGTTLDGGSATALRGDDFLVRWSLENQTLGDIFYVTRTNMPLGQGGTLSTGDYLDVLAFLLAENGFAPGTTALSADPARLDAIPAAGPRHRQMAAEQPPRCPDVDVMDASALPGATGPDQAALDGADAGAGDWLLPDQGYAGRRFSPLAQITPENVGQLAEVCTFDTGLDEAAQSAPLVHDGTLYFTTHHATHAIDAGTCALKWQYRRAPVCKEMWGRSRGLGFQDGILVRGTTDGYLLALNAKDGRRIWERRVAETDRAGGAIAMPPLVYQDLVIAGPAPSEVGLRGWVRAFDLRTGALRWSFDAVPAAGTAAADTWGSAAALAHGGGGVWTPFTLDVATGTLFVPVANPGPAYAPAERPGDNLHTNAVVALDVHTGALKWSRQLLPGDYHDWDLTHAGPLLDRDGDRPGRRTLFAVGKEGVLYLLDRDRGEVLYAVPVVRRENVMAPVGTDADTHFCPGLYGGVQWNGPAVDPAAGLVFVPTVEWCASLRRLDEVRFIPGTFYMGGTFRMDPAETARGGISVHDVDTGALRWRHDASKPVLAGLVATASGLLLAGELDGDLVAFESASGRELLRRHVGAPLGGGLITYAVAGRQFVAALAGNPSPLWPAGPGSVRIIVLTVPP